MQRVTFTKRNDNISAYRKIRIGLETFKEYIVCVAIDSEATWSRKACCNLTQRPHGVVWPVVIEQNMN